MLASMLRHLSRRTSLALALSSTTLILALPLAGCGGHSHPVYGDPPTHSNSCQTKVC